MKHRLTVRHALQQLAQEEEPFKLLFSHGSLEIEIYKPEQKDVQTPHTRDEVYVISSGHGEFVLDEKTQAVEAGEVLFVAAGVPHRFENFSDDFSTWVFFYGPEGGENTQS